MTLTQLNHITLACTDIDQSFTFYKTLLGFKPLAMWDKGAYFLIGNCWFCINIDENRIPSSCYTHYAFSVNKTDFQNTRTKLLQSGIQTFKENTSPGQSFYFLDPDGHRLEIHVGTWQDRIKAKKANAGSWKNVEWFV